MISPLKTALLLSYICIASISAAIITPALPTLAHDFRLSTGALSWVVSIFMLGYVIGQLIYGPLANRIGRIKALQTGLLINLLGIALCLYAANTLSYTQLLLGRFITALGAASGLSCTFILIKESLSEQHAQRALSFSIVSFTLGIGLAVSLGGFITQYWHWQDCFWLLLGHGLLMLGLTFNFKETLKNPIRKNLLTIAYDLFSPLSNLRLISFSVAVGLTSAYAYAYSASAPLIAAHTLQISPGLYGRWNLLNMIGMLASGLFAANSLPRIGAHKVLALALLGMLPIMASLYIIYLSHNSNSLVFFTVTAAGYFFSGLLFPAGSTLALKNQSCKANASSILSFINMGSAMAAVILLGYLPFTALLSLLLTIGLFYLIVIALMLKSSLFDQHRTATLTKHT